MDNESVFVCVCTAEKELNNKKAKMEVIEIIGWDEGTRVKTGALRQHHVAESPEGLDKSLHLVTEGSGLTISPATHHC